MVITELYHPLFPEVLPTHDVWECTTAFELSLAHELYRNVWMVPGTCDDEGFDLNDDNTRQETTYVD